VAEFGAASRGLVAWELGIAEPTLEPVWAEAVHDCLLCPTGAADLGEPTYRLTVPGRVRLRELQARSVRRPGGSDRSR
jgi:hypothetical protein